MKIQKEEREQDISRSVFCAVYHAVGRNGHCKCLKNVLFVILVLSAAEALWLIDSGD